MDGASLEDVDGVPIGLDGGTMVDGAPLGSAPIGSVPLERAPLGMDDLDGVPIKALEEDIDGVPCEWP
jgi:U2-associated protein SR140